MGLLALFSLGVARGYVLLMFPASGQSKGDLYWSWISHKWGFVATLPLLVLGLFLIARFWPRTRSWFGKAFLALCGLVFVVGPVLARRNAFEGFFEPLARPGFVGAADADHVEPSDLVVGVSLAGDSAAYPVSIIGYHHIVNDRLAGEPFVVTY